MLGFVDPPAGGEKCAFFNEKRLCSPAFPARPLPGGLPDRSPAAWVLPLRASGLPRSAASFGLRVQGASGVLALLPANVAVSPPGVATVLQFPGLDSADCDSSRSAVPCGVRWGVRRWAGACMLRFEGGKTMGGGGGEILRGVVEDGLGGASKTCTTGGSAASTGGSSLEPAGPGVGFLPSRNAFAMSTAFHLA